MLGKICLQNNIDPLCDNNTHDWILEKAIDLYSSLIGYPKMPTESWEYSYRKKNLQLIRD